MSKSDNCDDFDRILVCKEHYLAGRVCVAGRKAEQGVGIKPSVAGAVVAPVPTAPAVAALRVVRAARASEGAGRKAERVENLAGWRND